MGSFTDLLFQKGSTPVLEAGMGFAHQKQVVTGNNVANVETPGYTRQTLPEDEFQSTLVEAIEKRGNEHPASLRLEGKLDIKWDGVYPRMTTFDGRENTVERHDENSVSLEQELAAQVKNEMKMTAMQKLYKKGVDGIKSTAKDAV